MYAETELMFPYFQSFEAQQVQHYDEFICDVENPNNASLGAPGSLVETSTISDYSLGGEGELFNAPEPIIGDPLMGFDSMVNIESSIERGELLDEVFYACRNDILEKEGKYETPLSEVLSIKVPAVNIYQDFIAESPLQKSISSSNLSLMEGVDEAPPRKYVQDFPIMDFGEAYGMRRAFSEGDLKNLGSGSMSLVPSPAAQSKMTGCYTSEVRMQKLSRYRSKKSKRNFGRKIKYACRKALADSQPRVRGRFAKTD